MMRPLSPLAPLAALLFPISVPSAQTIEPLILTGDLVPGTGGTLSGITDVAINDDGEWILRSSVSTSGGSIEVAILNGAAVLNQGDILFDPPGLAVQKFDDLDLGSDGSIWCNIDTDAGNAMDEIMYRNLVMIMREGDPLISTDVPSGTDVVDVDGFSLSVDGSLFILGDIDSPLVSGTSEATLIRQRFDASGNLIGEDVLILEGDSIPGSNDLVRDVGTNIGAHDVAGEGDFWIAYARSDGASSGDEMVWVNGAPVAMENGTGPVLASVWDSLSANAVDINQNGDYVFRGAYQIFGEAVQNVIMLNDQIRFEEGDTSASMAPNAFESFGSNTPLFISDYGRIIFYARTDNTDNAKDDGYFLNDRFLVQENTTPIGTNVITNIPAGPNALMASPNGRWVIFEASLGDGREGAFRIDLGLIRPMESCGTNEATLVETGDGLPLLNSTVTFDLDGAQDVGMIPVFLLSTAAAPTWPPCGVMLPFGELLIDVSSGNPQVILTGAPNMGGPTEFQVTVPNDTNLLGRDYFAQGLFWDLGDNSPAENFRLSNGLQITLALP